MCRLVCTLPKYSWLCSKQSSMPSSLRRVDYSFSPLLHYHTSEQIKAQCNPVDDIGRISRPPSKQTTIVTLTLKIWPSSEYWSMAALCSLMMEGSSGFCGRSDRGKQPGPECNQKRIIFHQIKRQCRLVGWWRETLQYAGRSAMFYWTFEKTREDAYPCKTIQFYSRYNILERLNYIRFTMCLIRVKLIRKHLHGTT